MVFSLGVKKVHKIVLVVVAVIIALVLLYLKWRATGDVNGGIICDPVHDPPFTMGP